MKKISYRILAFILVMILATSLAACGSNTPAATTGQAVTTSQATTAQLTTEAPKPVELRISWWGSEKRHDSTLAALKAYSTMFPNVTVTPEYQGYDGYHDKLATQIAANEAADVFQFANDDYMADFAGSGRFLDIAPFIGPGKEIDISGLAESTLAWAQYKGVQYGIPTGINGVCLLYNKELFDKAKVDYPKDDWSWDDFKNAAIKINSAIPDAYGSKEIDTGFALIMARQKGKLLCNDNGELGIADTDLKDIFQTLNDWRQEKVMPPLEVSVVKNTQQDNLFIAGKAAMMLDFIATIPMYQEAMVSGEIGTAMVPGSRNDPSGVYTSAGMPWMIAKNSKTQNEAAKLINFLINDPEAAKALGTVRGVPSSKAARDTISASLSELEKKVFDAIERLTAVSQKVDPAWSTKGVGKINEILEKEREQTGFGKKTPEQAAKDAVNAAVKALNEAK